MTVQLSRPSQKLLSSAVNNRIEMSLEQFRTRMENRIMTFQFAHWWWKKVVLNLKCAAASRWWTQRKFFFDTFTVFYSLWCAFVLIERTNLERFSRPIITCRTNIASIQGSETNKFFSTITNFTTSDFKRHVSHKFWRVFEMKKFVSFSCWQTSRNCFSTTKTDTAMS